MNARRLAQLFRERARLERERAMVDEEIAAAFDDTPANDVPATKKRRAPARPKVIAPKLPPTDVDRQRARAALSRRGYRAGNVANE